MSSSKQAQPGSASGTLRVKSNLDYLLSLPEPPATFFIADVPVDDRSTFKALYHSDVIERVERHQQHEGSSSYIRNEYRIADWAVDTIDKLTAERETICPCGHGGLSNRGDHFVCGFEGCDERFERAELEVDG
jgi:hypothetical protein